MQRHYALRAAAHGNVSCYGCGSGGENVGAAAVVPAVKQAVKRAQPVNAEAGWVVCPSGASSEASHTPRLSEADQVYISPSAGCGSLLLPFLAISARSAVSAVSSERDLFQSLKAAGPFDTMSSPLESCEHTAASASGRGPAEGSTHARGMRAHNERIVDLRLELHRGRPVGVFFATIKEQ